MSVARNVTPPAQAVTPQPSQAQQQQLQQQEAHLVTVRVMRLSRPALLARPAALLLEDEPPPATTPRVLRSALAIPATFGSVSVGETLRCCISLANVSAGDVAGVALRAELHVSSGALSSATLRAVLLDATAGTTLYSGDRLDYSVSHLFAEPGQHVMVCTVNYMRPRPQQQQQQPPSQPQSPGSQQQPEESIQAGFRKYFSFKVGHCVDARARVTEVTNTGNCTPNKKWLVEAQVEMLSNVFLEAVTLDPPDNCIAAPLDSGLLSGVGVSAPLPPANHDGFPEHLPRLRSLQQYMRAGSQVRRVFELTQRNGVAGRQQGATLGRLLVSWRSTCGEPGRLQLPITQSTPSHHHQLMPIDMRVAEPDPSTVVQLLVPLAFRCVLVNRAAAAMLVRIAFVADESSGAAGVALVGTRNDHAPVELQPGAEHEFRCTLLPLLLGVQRLGSLSVLDVRTNRELFFPDLGAVVVQPLPVQQ